LTVPSSEHVQNLASVGQKLSSRTGTPACASISLTLFSVGCQYLSRPALSPEIIHSPLWLQTEARMATSCACCVVSKLKLRPDQSVNMPLAVEASSRRDSGVQQTWLTGQRSLLLLVCTKREQIPEVALLRHAAGGSISRTAFSVAGIVTGACRSSGRNMRSLIILRPGPAWSTVRRTMGLRMVRAPSSAPCCTCSGCIWWRRALPAPRLGSDRQRLPRGDIRRPEYKEKMRDKMYLISRAEKIRRRQEEEKIREEIIRDPVIGLLPYLIGLT